MNVNSRGEYPPFAILERTRRGLSQSADSHRSQPQEYDETLMDLADAYLDIWRLERRLHDRRGIQFSTQLPNWVLDFMSATHVSIKTS